MSNAKQQQQPQQWPRCFHCGQPGHTASSCPSSDKPRSAAGQEAFSFFISCRKDHQKKHKKPAKQKDPLHNFERVIQWMRDDVGEQGEDGDVLYARDPIAVLQAEADAKLTSVGDDAQKFTQKWHNRHKAKCNNLDKAHRESFGRIMNTIQQDLELRLNVTPDDVAASEWHSQLTEAVVLGRPANFSGLDEESKQHDADQVQGQCLKVYAVEKLNARCRYLHHLLFGEDQFSSKVRSLLLPLSSIESLDEAYDAENDGGTNGQDAGVNVVSLGGGPGFDHVALCIVSKFLHDIQPDQKVLRPRVINTKVFDLYDKEWEPIMFALGESYHDSLSNHAPGNNTELDYASDNVQFPNTNGKNMTMSHCDLRLGIDAQSHTNALAHAIETAAIICVQFVLHENASYILDPDGDTIMGLMGDLFNKASLGTVVICTDASNTLFPALKCTAAKLGWSYFGDEEQRESNKALTSMGPKSFVMLERNEMKSPCR